MTAHRAHHWPTPAQWVAFATPIAIIVAVIFQRLDAIRLKDATDRAAAEVVTVKETLKKSTADTSHDLQQIKETGDKTHKLVNSASLLNLKSNAALARRIAVLTNDPSDARIADDAEREYADQLAKQRSLDAGETKR